MIEQSASQQQSTAVRDSLIAWLLFEELRYIGSIVHDSDSVDCDYQLLNQFLGKGSLIPQRLGNSDFFLPQLSGVSSEIGITPQTQPAYMRTVTSLNHSELKQIFEPDADSDYGKSAIRRLRLLTTVILDLIEEESLSVEDFAPLYQSLDKLDPTLYETVLSGIKLFFDGDYLSAAYILTLQLEDYLRQIIQQTGQSTLEKTKMGLTHKPLGRVITELRPKLGEILYSYIYWVLKDYRGLNLRNAVAHGLFKKNNTQPLVGIAAIHIFCLVSSRVLSSARDVKG